MLSRIRRCADCRELIDPPSSAVVLEKSRPIYLAAGDTSTPDRVTVHAGHERRFLRDGYRVVKV